MSDTTPTFIVQNVSFLPSRNCSIRDTKLMLHAEKKTLAILYWINIIFLISLLKDIYKVGGAIVNYFKDIIEDIIYIY